MFKTHQAKFLKLVHNGSLKPALKTYNDTLLFYYLGSLAAAQTNGNLLEIGVGGSTYPMIELSEQYQKRFILIDRVQKSIDNILTDKIQQIFNQANIDVHCLDSLKLPETSIGNIGYCHIDGSKNYRITLGDLEFCANNLCVNGLICQDDYGNNKWPAVTDSVHTLINRGDLVMLFVGDSSAWLTKPEYYAHWMSLLKLDLEFNTLIPLLNIVDSSVQEKFPAYFFMQSLLTVIPDDITESAFDYYDQLLALSTQGYLQMPYMNQSTTGIHLRHKPAEYVLALNWSDIRGESWPVNPPVTKEEIDQLPNFVRDELVNLHQFADLYAQVPNSLSIRCVRPNPTKN